MPPPPAESTPPPHRRLWHRLWRWALAHPRRALATVLLPPLLAAPGLLRLELATDGRALIAPGAPALLQDAAIQERFDLRDPLVVYLETAHPAGLYNPDTLERLRSLHAALEALPGLASRVTSLASEARDRVDSLDLSPYLSPLPRSPAELAALRRDVAAPGLLHGTLVGRDERGATILVGIPRPAELASLGLSRPALVERVRATAAAFADPEHRVAVVGAPAAEVLLTRHLVADLVRLLPLALGVLGVVLALGCGGPRAVLLGLGEVTACLVLTFGAMGWLGVPVVLSTAPLPVILATVVITDQIHLLWHWRRRPEEGTGDAITATLAPLARPLTLTSLTTGLGFLAFTVSELPPLRAFGAFATLGVGYCWLVSLLGLPAALQLGWGPGRRPAPASRLDLGALLADRVPRLRRLRPLPALALLGLVTLAVGGTLRLEVQDGWLDNFAPSDPFRRDVERVHDALHGSHVLLAEISLGADASHEGDAWDRTAPLLDPGLLAALEDVEENLRPLPQVGGVLGPAAHLTGIAYLTAGRRPGSRTLPSTADGINVLWKRFEQGPGVHRRRQVATDDLRHTVITLFLRRANYQDTRRVMAAVRREVAGPLAPWGATVRFAGDVAVSQAMIRAVVRGQLTSVALALATLGAVLLLLYRRPGTVLLLLTPVTVSSLALLGTLGWWGLPLGVATSTFCALTLGLGVDFALHFHERTRAAAKDPAVADPVAAAMALTGPPILLDTLALALGFLVLTASRAPANAHLGLMLACGLAVACLTTLLLLGCREPTSATG